ncbi:MAG TPA: TatD family hydrolase, partial [Thermoplasmata archaeon]|nr:TatD family hydrolase [Thermoplasmata archaeon]
MHGGPQALGRRGRRQEDHEGASGREPAALTPPPASGPPPADLGDLPVVDHHCHLSPRGEGVEAARRFARAGGTHLFLATQQYEPLPPTDLEGYRRQFETTESLARSITASTGVVVYVVVAPYPIDLLGAADRVGLSKAVDEHEAALDLAGRFVSEQRAVAIGEVGRPHFPIDPSLAEASERTFRHALEVARDVDCPAIVHCEELDPAGYLALAHLASQTGIRVNRIVKHFA